MIDLLVTLLVAIALYYLIKLALYSRHNPKYNKKETLEITKGKSPYLGSNPNNPPRRKP